MAKFFAGLVTGVLLVILTVILLFVALLRFREKPPQIAGNSVLHMRLTGEIPRRHGSTTHFLDGNPGATVSGIWMSLKRRRSIRT